MFYIYGLSWASIKMWNMEALLSNGNQIKGLSVKWQNDIVLIVIIPVAFFALRLGSPPSPAASLSLRLRWDSSFGTHFSLHETIIFSSELFHLQTEGKRCGECIPYIDISKCSYFWVYWCIQKLCMFKLEKKSICLLVDLLEIFLPLCKAKSSESWLCNIVLD